MIEPVSNAAIPCSLLEWDSRFFGFRIAQAYSIAQIDDLLKWCRLNEIRCLYFRTPANELEQIHQASTNDFRFVDVRVTLDTKFPAAAVDSQVFIRESKASDIEQLRDIAAVSHEDSRFYQDSNFPREKCRELFQTWIANSCTGYSDCVLVPIVKDAVAGYATCHIDSGEVGRIGLFAVHNSFQGKGIATALASSSLKWLASHGCKQAEVVTQGRNIRAQRLYQKVGFRTKSIDLWFHKWFDPEK